MLSKNLKCHRLRLGISFCCNIEPAIYNRISILRVLKGLGLIGQNETGDWHPITASPHLSKDSPNILAHHTAWMQSIQMDIQKGDADSIHYSGAHSISKSDLEKIRQILLEAIERSHEIVGPSKEEELYFFSVHAFRP